MINLLFIAEVVIVIVPMLLTVAFVTISERKTMSGMQRILGPNIVGVYGTLQPFADALKLLLKEYIAPTQFNFVLFFLRSYYNFGIFIIRFSKIITVINTFQTLIACRNKHIKSYAKMDN